jgi:hypothetical protein
MGLGHLRGDEMETGKGSEGSEGFEVFEMADRTGLILKALGLFSPLRGARHSRTSKLLSQFAEPLGSRTFGIFLESGDKF